MKAIKKMLFFIMASAIISVAGLGFVSCSDDDDDDDNTMLLLAVKQQQDKKNASKVADNDTPLPSGVTLVKQIDYAYNTEIYILFYSDGTYKNVIDIEGDKLVSSKGNYSGNLDADGTITCTNVKEYWLTEEYNTKATELLEKATAATTEEEANKAMEEFNDLCEKHMQWLDTNDTTYTISNGKIVSW